MSDSIVFIGAGNMAEALVRGLVTRGGCPPGTITVTDPRPEQLAHFGRAFGVRTSADNAAAVADAATVVLSVKPQVMPGVLAELSGRVAPGATVVSIAAGIRCASIEAGLGGRPGVVRVMPNTPALVGKGISALCAGAFAGPAQMDRAEQVLRAVGTVVRVEESMMDAVTALSGSGPAYVFHLMESMLAAAGRLGVDPSVARQLVYQTVAGAAELAIQSPEPPEVLRARVTSKGGTTAAALAVLEERGAGNALTDAVLAAHRRAGELSQS